MRVYKDIDALPEFRNAVLTIGTFDGVHIGHQKIISQMQSVAQSCDGETVIITFHPHPRTVVREGVGSVPILTTLPEKIALLDQFGVDNLVIAPFNQAFAQLSAEEYITTFLVQKFHPKAIIIGYDHRFGHDRKGDYQMLEQYGQKYGFAVIEIPEQVSQEIAVSSTKIRESLLNGAIDTTNSCLGHPYFFEGTVVKGNQLGRTIGFPTANISIDNADKLIPANGVYAVRVSFKSPNAHEGKIWKGMMNIGVRPTVGGIARTIEVHILDFDQVIYGEILQIQVIAFLRSEIKFSGLDALKEQLTKDRIAVDELL